MRKALLVAVTCVFLTACGQLIRSQVSVFHEIPPGVQQTYAFLQFKEQEGSLEHKTYEALIRQQMSAKGYQEVSLEKADVIAFVQYGIDTGRQIAYSYPIMGRTGTASSYTSGTIQNYGGGYATYSGTTYNTPTYGVVGTGSGSRTEYSRFIRVDLVDRSALAAGNIKKVYEGRVNSQGSSGQLSVVMPAMVRALFEDFPGKSGSNRTVTLSRDP
jgi:hypothetical protein